MARRPASGAAGRNPVRRGSTRFWLLVIVAGITAAVILLLPLRRNAREAARRAECGIHLRQIGQALRAYVDAHGSLPPAFTVDTDGRPLASWRELLLPHLGDAARGTPAGMTPEVFQCPSAGLADGMTTYHLVVSPDGLVRPESGATLEELDAAASDTLLVIDVPPGLAVRWTSPVDSGAEVIAAGASGPHPGIVMALQADGAVVPVDLAKRSIAARRALVTPAEDAPPGSVE